MSMTVKDVIKWLQTLSADDAIYIDEGGLSLVSENDGEAYLEVGGQSEMCENDEDDDWEEDDVTHFGVFSDDPARPWIARPAVRRVTESSPRKCAHELKYSKEFDSVFCPVCKEWREKRCTDENCEYCKDRPEKPDDV